MPCKGQELEQEMRGLLSKEQRNALAGANMKQKFLQLKGVTKQHGWVTATEWRCVAVW